MLYDALALHVALVIVVNPNRKDHRKPDFVGEVSPFFPLCIDEESFCSMPNHERGTVAVTRQAPRGDKPTDLAGAIQASAGRRLCDYRRYPSPEWRGNDHSYAVYFTMQVLRRVAAADDESAETG